MEYSRSNNRNGPKIDLHVLYAKYNFVFFSFDFEVKLDFWFFFRCESVVEEFSSSLENERASEDLS